jgi:polyisoprenoid-binding protein YceI
MMTMKNTILAAIPAVLAALPFVGGNKASAPEKTEAGKANFAAVPAGNYNLDPMHSTVGFAVRHFEINWVSGRFKDFTGAINYDERDATKSTVEFAAKTESVDTGVEPRDQHLRAPDFFDAATYPEMKFVSTGIEKKGADEYVLRGDFTMKGVTKQIEFPFTFTGAVKDPYNNTRFGIEARTRIDRRDYGINYGNALPAGGFDVGNEITVVLQLEAMMPDAQTAATDGVSASAEN